MCLKLIYHNLACDVRPLIARGVHSTPIVDPYATPKPCPPECPGKECIVPYFRCLVHKCCMTSAEYIHMGCPVRCGPNEIIKYHVYSQWTGSTPTEVEIDQWEPLPVIDSYIPKLKIAVPATPAFREWRKNLLTKGAQVQQILELMEIIETRLAEELQHQHADHHICQKLDANWEKYRRYPTETRPEKCRNQQNITKLWTKLNQLSEFLADAEREYLALQNPPAGVYDFGGLITTLCPNVQNKRFQAGGQRNNANWEQWSVDDFKDTVHQMATFRF